MNLIAHGIISSQIVASDEMSLTFDSLTGDLDPVLVSSGGEGTVEWTGPSLQVSTGLVPSPALNEVGAWVVTVTNPASITGLLCNSDNLANLAGLTNFANLDTLDVQDNNLTYLDIRDLAKLVTVKCNGNSITTIYQNIVVPTLATFWGYSNSIVEVDPALWANLSELLLQDNPTLDVDTVVDGLETIYEPATVVTVNISGTCPTVWAHQDAKIRWMEDIQVWTWNRHPALYLWIDNLAEAPPAMPSAATGLVWTGPSGQLRSGSAPSLDETGYWSIDMDDFTVAETLWSLSNEHIRDIGRLDLMTGIVTLDTSFNSTLSRLRIDGMTALQQLSAHSGQLSDLIATTGLPAWWEATLSYTYLASFTALATHKDLTLNSCSLLTTVNLAATTIVEDLSVATCPLLTGLDSSAQTNLKSVNIRETNLTDIEVEQSTTDLWKVWAIDCPNLNVDDLVDQLYANRATLTGSIMNIQLTGTTPAVSSASETKIQELTTTYSWATFAYNPPV